MRTHTRVLCRSHYYFKLSYDLKRRLKTVNPFSDKPRPLQNSSLLPSFLQQSKICAWVSVVFWEKGYFILQRSQVEIDVDNETVFEFGIGEAVPLSEQDSFEHGQQGIGGTAAVVSKVTGSLTIQVLFDRLPINHLIQLQQWEAVDVFGNHGLCGLPEKSAHEKSPKCLGGNLGEFRGFWGILQRPQHISSWLPCISPFHIMNKYVNINKKDNKIIDELTPTIFTSKFYI